MRDVIYKHALLNAVEYGGKAEVKAVIGKVLAEEPSLKSDISQVVAEVKKIVDDVNSQTLEEQRNLLGKLGVRLEEKKIVETGLPELPNAKGKVVMRLAPYPSGPLHIGNARMAILNDEYVKRYKGRLLLVFDDTIGSEEKFIIPEAYKMITDDLKWLGVKYHKIVYKSDRIKIFYKLAEDLIKKNIAYVCECDAKTLRDNRANGVVCKHREQTSERNTEKWKKMLNGRYKEGKVTLRLKTDMQHPNPAFRDRVLFRVAERRHPRVGKRYKVWPMLEFSWAVDDHMLGVTHILRGKDLVIEDMMEEFIWNAMGWNKPEILHYGILNLEGVRLSKTESRKLIERKVYSGWDDARTWSLKSLEKRGVQPHAIRNFIINMGLSLADVKMPVEILYADNRKLIDSKANRYFAVLNPVKISVKNSKPRTVEAQLHPDFPGRGRRRIHVDTNAIYVEEEDYRNFKGREVGFMNLFSAKLDKNSVVTSENVKYDIQKIHWVSGPNAKIKVVMPDGKVVKGVAEPSIKKLKVGSLVQFPRIGFARVNKQGRETVLYFTHK
ncbi:MAG: glutamate--tRNA ligase [Candidatus Aenigmarchaeota archaeon]|nr:glutamate--tRNA ligase [Candidatus Aenigmarchaeota archaeon]